MTWKYKTNFPEREADYFWGGGGGYFYNSWFRKKNCLIYQTIFNQEPFFQECCGSYLRVVKDLWLFWMAKVLSQRVHTCIMRHGCIYILLASMPINTVDHLFFASILFRVYTVRCLFANTIIRENAVKNN